MLDLLAFGISTQSLVEEVALNGSPSFKNQCKSHLNFMIFNFGKENGSHSSYIRNKARDCARSWARCFWYFTQRPAWMFYLLCTSCVRVKCEWKCIGQDEQQSFDVLTLFIPSVRLALYPHAAVVHWLASKWNARFDRMRHTKQEQIESIGAELCYVHKLRSSKWMVE